MSHFTVGIITPARPTENELAMLLEPYDEEKEVLHYISREEIIAEERKSVENYKNDTYAEFLKDPEAYKANWGDNPKHIEYLEEVFPKKLKWTDEDFYKEGIKRCNEEDIMPDGSVKSTYNPDSKWDWYSIGGRWDGLLVDKNGKCHNCLKISDIANKYDSEEAERAKRFWEIYVEGSNAYSEEEIKEATEFVFFKKEYFLKKYQTKENYIKCQALLSTYALLDEDGWHEKGQMGWFGISNQKEDAEREWANHLEDLFNAPENQDLYLTIVDCHI